MSSALPSCPFDGSPPLNTGIAGIGVRLSIYIQALLASESFLHWQSIKRTALNIDQS
jgi:hypothetical protein